jgi:hypothetical protein
VKVHLSIVIGLIGIIVGFLAQRSRMCFVAGFRDYLLVRDRELLLGLFAFLVTIWILTSIMYSMNILKKGIPEYGDIVVRSQVEMEMSGLNIRHIKLFGGLSGVSSIMNKFLLISIGGGWLMGILSTFVEGCVLRQHVLIAQGSIDSLYYIIGFYCAVFVYYNFLSRFVVNLY